MQELITVMESQLEAYRALYDLSLEKRDVIKVNDVKRLQEIVSLEKALLVRTGALEAKRTQMTNRIGQKLHKEEIKLDDLIALIRPPTSTRLQELKQAFTGLLADLKRMNDLNSRLLETHLNYVGFMLNVAAGAENVSNVYGSTGNVGNNQATTLGILDASV